LDNMTGEMVTLSDAIRKVNNGVAELKQGVSELNGGVKDLRNGSQQYKNGMNKVKGNSSELVEASKSINNALATISSSLSGEDSDEIDLTTLAKLPEGLSVLGKNLNTTADGLSTLRESYGQAYGVLDQAMEAIPAYDISEKEFQDLYASGAEHEVLDKLKETYTAAQTAKGTYTSVKEGFDAVDTTLNKTANGMKEMGTQLNTTAKELTTSIEEMDITESITKLEEGLTELSTKYKEFHSGLVDYTGGVNQLSNSYGELHDGIAELSNGTNELENGVSELHKGTSELHEATNDLPNELKSEVDEMISEFENTDFEAKSFVSPKNNEKINTVQFIIKTESIEVDEQEKEKEPVKKEKSFWDKFIDLFS
jgi:putative membrane protein